MSEWINSSREGRFHSLFPAPSVAFVKKVMDAGPRRRNLSNTKGFQIMSKPVIRVSPGLSIKYCGRVMNKSGVSRVPVFDGKQIVGSLSMVTSSITPS